MMSLTPTRFITIAICLFLATTTYLPLRVHAGCSHLPSVSVSPPDGDITSFDDADQVGGLHQIDKITQVDVYRVDALFRNVVSKIVITYLRTDGESVILSHGKGGNLAGQVTFDEGQYLSAIEMFVDQYVQHMRLCRTDGICFGPFGYNTDAAPNRILYKQRSVIKALLGRSGNVVDKVRVYYETDRMYKAEIGEVVYQNITIPTIISDLSFESPKAKVTVDNLGSSVDQSSTVSFEETVSTYETTIVTKTKQLFGTVSLTKEPGFLVQLGVADLSATFTVGASFSVTLSESNTKEINTAITREYTVVAPPFAVVTGQVYWRQIKYAYDWNAPVQCYFTFEPQTAFRGGTIEGNMYGTQAFPHSYVKFTQTFTTTPPLPVPMSSPMTPPTKNSSNITEVEPTASPSLTQPASFPVVEAPPPKGTGSPVANPVRITMSPLPVSPPFEVIVPVSGLPTPLPTGSPTLKGSSGGNPLPTNLPTSSPLEAVAPGNGFLTLYPTTVRVLIPARGSPMSPLPQSPVAPPFNVDTPTISPTNSFVMSPFGPLQQPPVSPPFEVDIPVIGFPPSLVTKKPLSGSPMLSLSKAPTSTPTKFTDPIDDFSAFPTFAANDEPTNNPTTQKVSPTGRPTRKPRSNIYDDQDSEEKVTSDAFFFPLRISVWAVGLVLLFVVM